jgi:hypothetical protein
MVSREEIEVEKQNLRTLAKLTGAPFMAVPYGEKGRVIPWKNSVPGFNDYSFIEQSNCGIILRGLVCQDFESTEAFNTYYTVDFPLENNVAVVKSPHGWHVFFKGSVPYSRVKLEGKLILEIRSGNQYMVAVSSVVDDTLYRTVKMPETLEDYDVVKHSARLAALGWASIYAEQWTLQKKIDDDWKETPQTKGGKEGRKPVGLFDLVNGGVGMPDVFQDVDRHGPNTQYIWCCFHPDRKPGEKCQPSLRVRLRENYFYCFSCGARGGPADAYAKQHGLTPMEAAVKLANEFKLW